MEVTIKSKNRIRYTLNDVANTAFLQTPWFLFDEEFADLSNDARILYSLLRDRHAMSIKNGWCDEENHVYLSYKREDMQKIMRLSENTVMKVMNELKSHGLLEEEKQGRGRPNKIYLLAVAQTRTSNSAGHKNKTLKNCGSGTSNSAGLEPQNLRVYDEPQTRSDSDVEGQKMTSNKTNINKTDFNNTIARARSKPKTKNKFVNFTGRGGDYSDIEAKARQQLQGQYAAAGG